MAPTQWSELWGRAAAGDGEVFALFYQRHVDRVFSHCFRRLGPRPDAEDVTAEVFATAWRHRARISPHEEVDILPWLLTTANNLLHHHHRTVLRARRLLRAIPRDDPVADISIDIVEQEATAQALATISAVLDQLRRTDREIIELCVLNGLSPSAVAAARGVPTGTVRSRLSRALARARLVHQDLTTPADVSVRR